MKLKHCGSSRYSRWLASNEAESNVYRSLAHARSARAICQRRGANIEHPTLDWQLEQGAFSIINLRVLTCHSCQDKIQPQKRQFTQYTDPLTIEHPLPEDYTDADNPVSPIGFSPRSQTAGANIGTLLQAAGLNAAFDGNLSKTTVRSAVSFTPTAGFTNTIGKDWLPGGGLPLSIFTPLSYSVNRMTATGLLSVEKQGRHRYHRLAAPSVARMLESIMQVASELAPAGRKLSIGPKDAALRRARTCYDHLAGQLVVSIADGLMRDGYVELAGDAGIVTDVGIARLAAIWDGRPQNPGAAHQAFGAGSVPALSGLERAPATSRRHARRAHLRAQHATWMDPPIAGNPCRTAHAGRRARLSRRLRHPACVERSASTAAAVAAQSAGRARP